LRRSQEKPGLAVWNESMGREISYFWKLNTLCPVVFIEVAAWSFSWHETKRRKSLGIDTAGHSKTTILLVTLDGCLSRWS
jgi:hypothetical protein